MSLLKETLSPDEFLSCADHLLSLGVKDSNHAFHQGVFATAQESLIQQRYVVLRRWVLARRSLIFHTDIRSPKVKAIQQNPKTSFIFYSKTDRLQLRFECVSHVHHHNRLSRECFDQCTDHQKACYLSPVGPSQQIAQAHPEHSDDTLDPYDNFAVCVSNFHTLELLFLNRLAHVRLLYEWDLHGNLKTSYLAP